jgi:hypothetical protein
MTYSSQGLIQAADYNGFVNNTVGANVNASWNTAYGQTAISTVSALTDLVTAPQWATLVNTLASLGAHTNTTITARTAPTSGQTIGILAALNTDITNCFTNRFNAVSNGTQFTGWTGTNSKTTQTGTSGGAAWSITFTNTVTWTSSAAASYFFNAGGIIRIQTDKSSTGLTGDPEWNDLAANRMGLISITKGGLTQVIAASSYTGSTVTGGTVPPAITVPGTGWDSLVAGAAATIVYKQFADTAPYTSNYIQHAIAKGASSNTLVITTTWVAVDTNTPPVGGTDPISGGTAPTGATPGTAPCTVVTYFPPESTNLTNTWGTPTVAASVA